MGILAGLVLGVTVALLAPGWVLWMRPGLQPLFAVTMFFLGTLVRREDVSAFATAPGRALSGLAFQYTIMPLSAFGVSLCFDDPVIKSGIILVGCMPGAMTSNVMTALLSGDLILSVTMTTVATLASPLLLALWLPLLLDTQLAVPVASLAWDATWMVVLPVAAGTLLRAFRPAMPRGWDRLATVLASASILAIITLVAAVNRERLEALGPGLALGMLALNLAGYGLAFAAASLRGWPPRQRRTLVVEVGMQNAGLGSVLALSHLGEAGAVPSAFYTILCVFTAACALPLIRRRCDGAPRRPRGPAPGPGRRPCAPGSGGARVRRAPRPGEWSRVPCRPSPPRPRGWR
ncbi:MAG: bile acid:sodium symporter family protein [Myxococcota bacterium]